MSGKVEQINAALHYALAAIQGRRSSEILYGGGAWSAGCTVGDSRFPEHWLKVRMALTDDIDRQRWDGELLSICFDDIRKPKIFGHIDWEADGFSYRAVMMSVARGIISRTPRLTFVPHLESSWWVQLADTIKKIQARQTDRICYPDSFIAGHLMERFGLTLRLPLSLRQTAHGDPHWANLTAPDVSLIDWDYWGQAPYATDVATLHVFSTPQSAVLAKLKDVFSAVMAMPEYDLTFLFIASTLMRKFDLRGMYRALQPDLLREAKQILEQGRIKEFCV